MARKVPGRWRKLRTDTAQRSARLLGRVNAGDGPTPLAALAKESGIGDVVFRPLLVNGGLVAKPGGFRMYVHSAPAEADEFRRIYNSSDDYQLPPRVRYTIAHEIAHTLFYAIGSNEDAPKPLLANSLSRAELEELEYTCNIIARRLLLTQSAIEGVVRSPDFLTPGGIKRHAARLAVSIPVLIYGIKNWNAPRGVIALATDDGRITAIASDILTKAREFNHEREVRVDEIVRPESFLLRGGQDLLVEWTTERPHERRREHSIARAERHGRSGWIITRETRESVLPVV